MAARCLVFASSLLLALAVPSASGGAATAAEVVLNVSGKAATAAEVITSLDSDRNGTVSRGEFWTWALSASAGQYLESVLAALPAGVEDLFGFVDLDGSGSLNVTEVAQVATLTANNATYAEDDEAAAARGREKVLRLRARASAGPARARRLDKASEYKEGNLDALQAEDPRCKAPQGYPTSPEGWLCVNGTMPIFCHKEKRWGTPEQCEWQGNCQSGSFGNAGCEYPLCNAVQYGGEGCLKDLIYDCRIKYAHGRTESHPVVTRKCDAGSECRTYSDGVPPTRRRRTTNCHKECDDDGCRAVCHEDPADPPYTTCVKESCQLLESATTSYVRSCIS